MPGFIAASLAHRHALRCIASAAGLCALVAIAAAPAVAQQGGERPPTPVEMQEVSVDTMVDTLAAIGTIRSNESVVLRPEIPGLVKAIHFEEGEPVEAGELLFELDASIYHAELAEAEARFNLARRNYARAAELLDKGSGTARARDEALSELEASRATVELGQARLEQTKIHAPFSGIAGLRQVSEGAYVLAGQELVNLESVQPVKADFAVPERYLSSVSRGQEITVRVEAFPEQEFKGEVMAIDPRIDATDRSLSVRAVIENPDMLLRPGLFARVDLTVDRREQAILIPEEALMPRGTGFTVYKVVDGKAEQVEVRIGKRRGSQVEIVDGLSPGDTVITAGQLKVQPGAPVQGVAEAAGSES